MEVVSYIKYLRISPKKIRELGNIVVGLNPAAAIESLRYSGNKGGKLLADALSSANSNAVNNHKLDSSNLKIKSVEILKGPFFKRWQPVSRGMAHQIKKRTAHIRVVITEKDIKKKEVQIVKTGKSATVNNIEQPEKKTTVDNIVKPEKPITEDNNVDLKNKKVQKEVRSTKQDKK
jgi:large subunit ribosomal protein L22